MQVVPPQLKAVLQYQGEPRGQGSAELGHRLVDLVTSQVPHLAHLIAVRPQGHVLLQEQDVVYLVLAPHTVSCVRIVDACEVPKVLGLQLLSGYAQFVVQATLGGQSDAQCIALLALLLDFVERMAAAGVGVGIREGYLP